MSQQGSFTPRETVSELDRYIIGQQQAKRAVAIALRNRWRRQRVPEELRDEIAPKNIIMVGPTGVGKTEIARRLAKLANAPFIKVEASKFTEVGYVGRDVESIVRDLVEQAVQLARREAMDRVRTRASERAEERLVKLLARQQSGAQGKPAPTAKPEDASKEPPATGSGPAGAVAGGSAPSAAAGAGTDKASVEAQQPARGAPSAADLNAMAQAALKSVQDALVTPPPAKSGDDGKGQDSSSSSTRRDKEGSQGPTPGAVFGPFVVGSQQAGQLMGQIASMIRGQQQDSSSRADKDASEEGTDAAVLAEIRRALRAGVLEDAFVEFEVSDQSNPFMTIFGAHGAEEMELNMQEMLGHLPGMRGRQRKRRAKVSEARKILEEQEAQKLLDHDAVQREAVKRTEQSGIVFLDEIDKVAVRRSAGGGADVSREGVQRDLLPIVEGSTVNTKYGPVKTDHVLFIAAGAFHVAKVSDLIPELQGRFPIRVELQSLSKADFVRVLTEPKNALTRQYEALLATEDVTMRFTHAAIEALADYAALANERAENIGARRLHTVVETLLEELSFTAPERNGETVVIDDALVQSTLRPIVDDEALSRFVL